MVGLYDELGKIDKFVEKVKRKVEVYLGEVLEDKRDKMNEKIMEKKGELKE